jgi:isoleucyl-tRNA synthetase
MSKSRGNTVDPWMIIDKYGTDTLRWYLLAVSPPWVPTKFDEDGIRETASRFFGTLVNVYAFFTLYANIDEVDPDDMDIPVEQRPEIDRWVISRLNTMLDQISKDMAGYELSRVTRAIESFLVDEVSNWYVRRSRERFWSNEFDLDKKSAYRTLYEVLIALSKAMAPFAPFLAEDIYLNLTRGKAMESVHLEDYPTADKTLIDPSLEERMGLVITVVSLGRSVRNKMQIKVRQPLRKMMVNGKHQGILKDMEDLVKEELNVKHIEYVGSLTDYVDYEVRANLPVAGPKFGKDLRTIIAALGKLDAQEAVAVLETEGTLALSLDGRELTLSREDIDVRMSAREGFAVEVEDDTFVVLDTEIDQELAFEGHAREIVSKVQTMRKNAGFDVVDHISMVISSDDVILEAVRKHMDYIQTETLCDKLELTNDPVQGEEWDINGHNATIRVEKL